jgi:PAS domain S-box-containing protein
MIPKTLLRILLVEDSVSDAALLGENLRLSNVGGLHVEVRCSLQEAIDYCQSNPVDAALLDLTLPDSSGLETVRRVRRHCPDVPIVVLTGIDDEQTGVQAVRTGAQDYLIKGRVDGRTIASAIRYAIERKRMETELRRARDELEMRVQERTQTIRQQAVFLEAYFRHSLTPVVFLDAHFNFIRVNDAYARACQKQIEDFPGHNHFEFYPHAENQAIFEEVVRTKTPYVATAKAFAYPDHPEWGTTFWNWTLVPVLDSEGKVELLVFSLEDVTDRKRAEDRRRLTNSLLEQFVTKTSRKEYLDSVVKAIRDWSGSACVGIRIANDAGLIPYESCLGFSEEFLDVENALALKSDKCLCIRAVAQTPESPDRPLVTSKGSFHSDDAVTFLRTLKKKEAARYRGTCMKHGFASLAVIPIRYRQKVLGVIHLADPQKNKVPPATVEFLEDMAALVGEAVHRFDIEQSLRLNENRLLEAQRMAHLGNWELEIATNKLLWSDEVYRIFGFKPKQIDVTYELFMSCVHPDDRDLVRESVHKALDEGKPYNVSHRIIKSDGGERVLNEKAEVVYDANRQPARMIGTVHDITEQKKAEEEIRASQKALRELTAELLLAEERERRRLAHDLHDSVGQILAFSARELKTLEKSLSPPSANALREVIEQLHVAVKQTRTLSFDLSPSILYEIGFEAAVEDLLDRMSEERHIQCRFEDCLSPKPLADDVKILLYRSIRELLINAAKHADAALIKVSLSRSNSDICIKVEDDGRGFNAGLLEKDSKKRKGFGLFSIRERLNHIGGSLTIESAEGRGTKAILIAPLDLDSRAEEEGVNS